MFLPPKWKPKWFGKSYEENNRIERRANNIYITIPQELEIQILKGLVSDKNQEIKRLKSKVNYLLRKYKR